MSKKISLKKMIRTGGYIKNPVLVQVVGICPVAAAATSLFNALVLSAVFTVSLILCELAASVMMKKITRWIRVGLYIILSTAVVFPAMYLLEKYESPILASLGVYLPLMAMSSLTCVHCEKYAVKHSAKESLFDALASSIGYSGVLVVVGIIREIFGNGTIAEYKIPFLNGFNGILMPFGGLFIIGLLSALHKATVIKKNPKMSGKIEKRFVLDETKDEEGTFTFALKQRFGKKNKINQ